MRYNYIWLRSSQHCLYLDDVFCSNQFVKKKNSMDEGKIRETFSKRNFLQSILFYDMIFNLVLDKLPTTAQWVQNGITVAGSATGESGSSLNRLRRNVGVYCADDDILYIADANNNRTILIALSSTTALAVAGGAAQPYMLSFPTDLFVTRTSVYVMDTGNFRVLKWSRDFVDPVTVAGISGVKGDAANMMALSNSYNLFVDNYGNLFVSDADNHRVMRFPWSSKNGTNGTMVAGTGISGSNTNQLNEPKGIFVTDKGILYITDCNNHRIQKWIISTSSGVTVAGTSVAGRDLSQLAFPRTVLVDSNEYMYITDYGNDRIMRWAPGASAGECIVACSGTRGINSNQLAGPISMTFDSTGSLYVSEYDNNRVQKFQILDETSIKSHP